MTRTGTLGRLFGHVAEPAVQLHPQDMARRGLKDGDLVHVTSRRGSIVLPVQACGEVAPEPGLHRHALGPRVPERRSSTGEPLAGVNALTTSGLLPGVQAARVQARGGEDPEGRAALVAAGHGLAARGRGAGRARGLARADAAVSALRPVCPFPAPRRWTQRARRAPACCFARRRGARRSPAQPDRALARLAGDEALQYADPKRASAAPHACGGARWTHLPRWKVSCWPVTPAPRAGSARCCKMSSRPRPMPAP
jgi:hypothetical protein